MDIKIQQKEYYNKIQSSELKSLLRTSYYFLSMNDEEKLDFLIWLSFIHENKEAEAEIIQSFKDENNQTKEAFNDEANYLMTDEESKKQDEVIKKELSVLKKQADELDEAVKVAFAQN